MPKTRDRKGSRHKITLNHSFQIDWLIKEILSYHYDWDCQIMSKYYHAYYCFRRLIHHLIWNWQLRVIFTMKMTKNQNISKSLMQLKNSSKSSSKTFVKEIHAKLIVKTVRWKSFYTKNHWKETKGNKMNHKKSQKKLFGQTNKKNT